MEEHQKAYFAYRAQCKAAKDKGMYLSAIQALRKAMSMSTPATTIDKAAEVDPHSSHCSSAAVRGLEEEEWLSLSKQYFSFINLREHLKTESSELETFSCADNTSSPSSRPPTSTGTILPPTSCYSSSLPGATGLRPSLKSALSKQRGLQWLLLTTPTTDPTTGGTSSDNAGGSGTHFHQSSPSRGNDTAAVPHQPKAKDAVVINVDEDEEEEALLLPDSCSVSDTSQQQVVAVSHPPVVAVSHPPGLALAKAATAVVDDETPARAQRDTAAASTMFDDNQTTAPSNISSTMSTGGMNSNEAMKKDFLKLFKPGSNGNKGKVKGKDECAQYSAAAAAAATSTCGGNNAAGVGPSTDPGNTGSRGAFSAYRPPAQHGNNNGGGSSGSLGGGSPTGTVAGGAPLGPLPPATVHPCGVVGSGGAPAPAPGVPSTFGFPTTSTGGPTSSSSSAAGPAGYGNFMHASSVNNNNAGGGGGGGAGGGATKTSDGFISARDQHDRDVKAGRALPTARPGGGMKGPPVKMGLTRNRGFNPPLVTTGNNSNGDQSHQQQPGPANPSGSVGVEKVLTSTVKPKQSSGGGGGGEDGEPPLPEWLLNSDGSVPESLQGMDPKLVIQVAHEILENAKGVTMDDIAGLQHAKSAIHENLVLPLTLPSYFTGLRSPPRGLLLFGPPGTGKTLIARAIATEAKCTFFNISASSLMSKWVGEGEKLVRCLFAVAAIRTPAVVFIDEIDSLLTMRSEGEMDAIRRVKTEFLVQLDGVGTDRSGQVLVIGATNRPQELDEAARRRMEQRLYIPLPDAAARAEMIRRNIRDYANTIAHNEEALALLAGKFDGYSGADMRQLCREASMAPMRELKGDISPEALNNIRPMNFKDFLKARSRVKPSVSTRELEHYVEWNQKFGSWQFGGDHSVSQDGVNSSFGEEFENDPEIEAFLQRQQQQ